MKNNETIMTNQEILEAKAKAAALRAEANVYAKAAREAEAAQKADEATQLSMEEVEATAVVEATSEEKVEAPVVVAETPEEEEEVAEEVTETSAEEVEAPVVVAETPEEEEEVTEEVTETSAEEVEAPVVVAETPEEEDKVTGKVIKTSSKDEVTEDKKDKKSIWLGILGVALAIALLIICIMAASMANMSNDADDPSELPGMTDEQPGETDQPGTNEQPGETEQPGTNEQPTFVMSEFVNSVVNIAGQLTDEDNIEANVNIFVENIGEDKLVELIEKNGEINVQKAIAEMLVFTPEIKMQQYIANKALDYNPNAESDYDAKLQEADKAYKAATGKNPDGALMSKEWYESLKASQTAVKAKLAEEGDAELLTWYTAKTTEYSVMWEQIRDTEEAEAYKEEVKLELVNSNGTIKLLELQLEKEVSGELTVMDNVTMQYTTDYQIFILNNYMYVVAN